MLSDRTFKIALLVSIAGHSMLLYGWPGFVHIFPDKKAKNPLEISYYELKKDIIRESSLRENEALSEENLKIEKEKCIKGELPATKIVLDRQKTRIALPSGEIPKRDLEEKTLYLDYYQGIREKIRRVANYNYYNYSKIGEIYLSFVLESSGNLKNIELFNDKSTSDRGLKEIAFNSVKEASPFPPFPRGLSQKELSFNVVISFERGN